MPKAAVVCVLTSSLLLAACGGKQETPTTPAASGDIGRDVMTALVAAAAAGDAQTAWNLLSKPSQRRAGPTIGRFEKKTFPELRRELLPFAKGKLPIEVSERIDDRFGIVSLARGRHAYAAPLRHEGSFWRIELPGGPLRIAVLGPPPNSRGKFSQQIGVESHGPGGAGVALLYLDGVTLDPKTYSGPKSATIYANFTNPLVPGRHTVVAYVNTGNNATARAWTFVP